MKRPRIEGMADAFFGVQTSGNKGEVPSGSFFGDGEYYASVSWQSLLVLLARVARSSDVRRPFVDIGCGPGRALCAAGLVGFKNLIGVELNYPLADLAQSNLASRSCRQPGLRATIIRQDAARLQLAKAGVVYMFNPFGNETMKRVVDGLSLCADRQAQPIDVLYVFPRHREILDERPLVSLIDDYRLPFSSHQVLRYRIAQGGV